MTRPIPYPADTKAKGWRFELDHERIDQSDTWALATPALRPWLLMTWLVSWKQIPCGSLPADDELIAARLGMDLEQFTGAKKVLMRGWWLAEDGRLYHDTVVEMVQSMLAAKNKERDRKAAYRDKKAAERGELSRGTDTGHPAEVPGPSGGCDDTGTGTYIPEPVFLERADENGDFLGPDVSHGTTEGQPSKAPAVSAIVAAQISMAMKRAGIQDPSPSNQRLLTLIAAGATVEEFKDAAKKAVAAQKGFLYALGIVAGERKAAAAMATQLHTGPLPPRTDATRSTGATRESFRERDARLAAERMAEFAPNAARKLPGQPIETPRNIIDMEPPYAIAHQST